MTRPLYFSKSLVTASSTGLGSVSSATPTVVTLKTSALDTPRRIIFSSTGGSISSGVTITVTGTIEGGGTKVEQIAATSTTAGAAITTLDFQTITSVAVSCGTLPISIGTNNVGGTRWVVADQVLGGAIGCDITFSSSAGPITASAEWTLDDPTGIYPISTPGVANPQPTVMVSSVLSAVNTMTAGVVNLDGNVVVPIFAYRLTITSSSSTAGTAYATFLQQG